LETDDASGYRACLRCGKIMPAAALYCNSCGADLSAEPAPGLRGAATLEGFGESLRSSQVPETGTSPAARPPSTTDGSSTETAAGSYYRAAPPSCPAYAYSPLAYAQRRTDNLAIASLACALASYALVPILAAVAAIVMGYMSRERIRKAGGELEGDGIALAGIIVGVSNIILYGAVLLLIIVAAVSS